MINMIVRYQNTHDRVHGNFHVFQKLTYGSCRDSGIYQNSMELISKVITIAAAATAETAKIQFHR
jgi:hypothetical protein